MRTLALLILVALAPAARALDAEATTPYRWRVLIQFDPHPLVTPGYRTQVTRELSAALTPLVEGVGTVAVIPIEDAPADPFAQLVKKSGFAAFADPSTRTITGDKTHLLAVSVAGGGVKLRVRGLDGSSGLVTPGGREATEREFAQVGRAAGLLVGREFGPVGTLDLADPAAERVQVRFRAGGLPGFDRHVRAGDVFALSLIRETGAGTFGLPRELTLLRAEADARGGRAECRVLTAFGEPFRTGRGVLGFRCVKLATTTAPLTVRLLDPAGKPPPPGNLIQVRASDIDFLPRSDGRDRLTSEAGVYRTGRPLRGVACVVISVGTVGEERFPIPVTGPGPVTVTFQPDPAVQKLARVENAREELRVRLEEARESYNSLVRDFAKKLDAGQNPEALARGEQGLVALAAQDAPIADDLKRFRELAGADSLDLKPFGEAIARLAEDRGRVKDRVEQLKAVVEKNLDPGRFEKEFRAKDLAARVRLALDRGDVPGAADLLEQLAAITGDTKPRETRAKLLAEYKPRSDEHAKARAEIPKALGAATTLTELGRGLIKLEAVTDTLAEADDRFGLRAIDAAIEASYAGKVSDVLGRIDATTERGREDIKEFARVRDGLRQLQLTARGKATEIEAGAKP